MRLRAKKGLKATLRFPVISGFFCKCFTTSGLSVQKRSLDRKL